MFSNGEPVKWLTTLADGRVARQVLSGKTYQGARHVRNKAVRANEMLIQEQVRATGDFPLARQRPLTKGGLNLLTRSHSCSTPSHQHPPQQIKAVHESFFTFRSKYSDFKDPNTAPLCVAWYNDGKKELLQSKTLLMLMKHREWRVQVTALQIYIKPKREDRGHYDTVHQIRLGADDVSERNAALDIVTKSLAMYAEKAYAVNPSETDDDGMQSIATPPTMPTSNLKVDTMDAEFIFDENENLWFSHLSNVMVQVVHAKRERNMELKRLEETKQIEAASVVAKELKRLLRMASSRGVSVQSSFEHFDSQGVGYADVNNLVEGLARLGIGISFPAAEVLMSMLGTGEIVRGAKRRAEAARKRDIDVNLKDLSSVHNVTAADSATVSNITNISFFFITRFARRSFFPSLPSQGPRDFRRA